MATLTASVAANFSTQLMGVDLNNVFTADAASAAGAGSGYDNPPHAPLDITHGTNGGLWLYINAITIINQYDCVYVDQFGNASQITKALADTYEGRVGFAQIAIASGSYGWVALSGTNLKVTLLASTAKDAPLYTTSTAGVLSATSSSQDLIAGVTAITAAPASPATSAEPINVSWPRILQ